MLELEEDTAVYLPSCEIVRDGVLLVGYIGNPVVGVYIIDAEQIEAVDAYPYVLKYRFLVSLLVVECTETHTDIGTLICGCTERHNVESAVWCAKW